MFSRIAWRVIENTPEIIAWLAMMVATVERMTAGIRSGAGTSE